MIDTATAGAGDVVAQLRQETSAVILKPICLAEWVKTAAALDRIEKGVPRVSTGWQRLDTALGGGFSIPSLNVLGAAPKSGKSTWAQMIAAHHVEAGGVSYVLDLENGRGRYARQLLCRMAQLGPKEVSAARRDRFGSRDAAARWAAAKTRFGEGFSALYAEFTPPGDFAARVAEVKQAAGARPLLVVVDSLQKLPGGLEDRRATIDGWVRLFERLRHEHDAVFLVVSEIKRSQRGDYQSNESAFKESGGIEYAADLAMTLTRPRADEDEEPVSTLRIELARDCDEDPRGDVASYRPQFPFYGLEELDPVERKGPRRRGPSAEKSGLAREFLEARLAGGAVQVAEVIRDGLAQGLSRSVLYRVKDEVGVQSVTLNLKNAWRLP